MLTAKVQGEIIDALYDSAATLAEGSDGLLQAYRPDLKRFGYQSLLGLHHHFQIDYQPIGDTDTADAVASQIDRRYRNLPAALEQYNQMHGTLDQMGELMRGGQNVALGMEHADLFDILLGEVGISNHFRRQHIPHRPILIASKAMDFLGVRLEALDIRSELAKPILRGFGVDLEPDNTIPVRQFLGKAATVYLTIPDTKTFADIRGLQRKTIEQFNRKAMGGLMKELRKDKAAPALLGVAAPGTTVKKLNIPALDDGQKRQLGIEPGDDVEVIGRINPGIRAFLKRAVTYATAIRLDDDPPKIAIDKDFMCVATKDDVNTLASKLVTLASSLEPHKKFIYDEMDELPVIRK